MALNVFISYRRADAAASARHLAETLKRHFGDGHVFFDVRDLSPGTEWQEQIAARAHEADVVLVVVGPRWLATLEERSRQPNGIDDDVMRTEVMTALRRGRRVVPVLVDGAAMPDPSALPRAFRQLAGLEAAVVGHATWDDDVRRLIVTLERSRADPPPVGISDDPPRPRRIADAPPAALPPDDEHYADLVDCLNDGSLVPMVGPGINGTTSPWCEGCGRLPTADELAGALARRFRLPGTDLTRISQHILLRRGPGELHRALREILIRTNCEPTPAHRFLARLPERLDGRHLLVVTTNYDTALERAFEGAHEPFDLAVFMASGDHKGRFLHVPWDGSPTPVERPNEYVEFPINDDGELARTVIMKVHGGPVPLDPLDARQLDRNYVITEDDYIAYLSRSPAESLIPTQLLRLLRESHLLFLGYGVREWSLRVFLQRVWVDDRLENSWSVQPSLDRLDRGFWERLRVERFVMPLPEYLENLERHITKVPEPR